MGLRLFPVLPVTSREGESSILCRLSVTVQPLLLYATTTVFVVCVAPSPGLWHSTTPQGQSACSLPSSLSAVVAIVHS